MPECAIFVRDDHLNGDVIERCPRLLPRGARESEGGEAWCAMYFGQVESTSARTMESDVLQTSAMKKAIVMRCKLGLDSRPVYWITRLDA